MTGQNYAFLLFFMRLQILGKVPSICLKKSRYSEVLMRPELRCGIQTCPGTTRFWCVIKKKCPTTKSSQPQNSDRNEKNAMLFGAGYTNYQTEMIFLNLFRAQNAFLWPATEQYPEHHSVAWSISSTVRHTPKP